MNALIQTIADKKAELDHLRLAAPHGLSNFEHVYNVELTYTSNAIEGNTLTRSETMMVIEQGITIGGKPLRDHLEAIDHHDAILYVREIARRSVSLTEMDVRTLHSLVVRRSLPDIAGRYADQGRFVLTDAGPQRFPSAAEVPTLMGEFAAWLNGAPDSPETAFGAHLRLVNIHPFNDGNGRAARLLMNLVLIRAGYPPVAVRPEDRPNYIAALQQQTDDQGESFTQLMYQRLDAILNDYLGAFRESLPASGNPAPPGADA